jgi:glycosyltransferase involved in cell wall biosynthesis
MQAPIDRPLLTGATTYQGAPALRTRPRVSAIVPARDEAPCIGAVVKALLAQRDATGAPLIDEVIVADNGSTDGTAQIAQAAGARTVFVAQAGYGRACWDAVQTSTAQVLLFVDGDGAADAHDAHALLTAINAGADMAIGVRVAPAAGAMSAPQIFGNGLACALMRWIWRMPVQDLGPHRAIRRSAFDALDMQDRSYGWTVEMQLRAHQLHQRVVDVPVAWYARAGGQSKVSGTVRGVWGAGVGILGMITRLWWRERQRQPLPKPTVLPTQV